MTKTIRMDRAGRVVIPQAIREKYGLVDGSFELELSESVDGIVLKPKGEEVPAERDESGWLVFQSGGPGTVDPVAEVHEERERRHGRVTGE